MATLETYYSQIEEILGVNSVDSGIDRELIVDLINQQRELWIKNEINKSLFYDPSLVQSIDCVSMEVASSIDCPGLNVPTNCKLLRTKCTIPDAIYTKGGNVLYTKVSSPDILEDSFQLKDYSEIIKSVESRFSKDKTVAFKYKNRYYLYGKKHTFKLIKFISIQGIYTNPLEVAKFNSCDTGELCYRIDKDPYPLTSYLWEYMRPYIIQTLREKQSFPNDEANDTKDNHTELKTK
jgi:hypothetical protein